jgi:hypothetical protein
MKLKKIIGALGLMLASSYALATPEVGLDYSNPDLDPRLGTINDSTNPLNAAIGNGWFIWADESYERLFLAFSDAAGEDYSSQITVATGLNSAATISVENGGIFVNGPAMGLGTVQLLDEYVAGGVDVVELSFSPEIQLNQDIEFWLSSTNTNVDTCGDFTGDASDTSLSSCIGQTFDSKMISIWDATVGAFTTDFDVEMQMFTGNNNSYFSQNFQLTRVSNPSAVAVLGLAIAGLAFARRSKIAK